MEEGILLLHTLNCLTSTELAVKIGWEVANILGFVGTAGLEVFIAEADFQLGPVSPGTCCIHLIEGS